MTAVYQGLSWAAFRTRSEPWGDVADSSLETTRNENENENKGVVNLSHENVDCDECDGSGRRTNGICRECNGLGYTVHRRY